MKNRNDLRTQFAIETEAKELAIYNEYNELVSKPNSMKTVVDQILMEKYKIHSATTIWSIRKRVEKRLGLQKKNNTGEHEPARDIKAD